MELKLGYYILDLGYLISFQLCIYIIRTFSLFASAAAFLAAFFSASFIAQASSVAQTRSIAQNSQSSAYPTLAELESFITIQTRSFCVPLARLPLI